MTPKQTLVLFASLSAGFLMMPAEMMKASESNTTSSQRQPAEITSLEGDHVATLGTQSTEESSLENSRDFIETWLKTTIEEEQAEERPTERESTDTSASTVNEIPVDTNSDAVLEAARGTAELNELLGGNNVPASLYAHELWGHEAATVYLEGLPLVTFTAANNPSANPEDMAADLIERLNQLAQSEPESYDIGLIAGGNYAVTVDGTAVIEIDDTVQSTFRDRDRSATAASVANQMRRVLQGASPIDASDAVVVARASSDYTPNPVTDNVVSTQRGLASWYGPGFAGRLSANGEIFNPEHMTAAHKYLPFNTMVEVINLVTGSSVVVRINDRGPFVGERIIDLSAAAARSIGLMQRGVGPVEIRILN
ncbi:MAG: septal ring lytic transglycosylase RlpA family protein [Cyanobacteria bacterium P01_E01_bin.34]